MTRRRAVVYWTGFSVILALLIVAPLVLPEFWRRFVTEILIWGLLAMSSDILIGYAGMVSFGHSALFGLGLYGAAAALLSVEPPNLWLAILYGLVAAAGVAAFVAYFSTRLRDIYFAITTLIFSQIFYVIIFTWTEVTGGENGLTFSRPALAIPGLFSVAFTTATLHWFVLAVVTLSYLVLRRITQSPFGMVLQAIRENEARTRAIGYPVQRYKIVAVMLSGLFAGLAGVLYAIQNRFAAPDFVFFLISGEVVIFNVMGGIGTLVGPIVGAAFFLLLREALSRFFTEYYLIPLGLIFMAVRRPGRLDGAGGTARSRGHARGAACLSERLRRGDRALRGLRRQVHGRRRAGLFRLSAGARGRGGAGGAGGAGARRDRRRAEDPHRRGARAHGSASRPGSWWSATWSARVRRRSRRWSARRRTSRHGCRRWRSPAGGDRRSDAPAARSWLRARGSGRARAQGDRWAGAGLAVTGERPVESRFEAMSGPALLPMVGRDQELALLLERWALAKAGEGQGVLLVGEAGHRQVADQPGLARRRGRRARTFASATSARPTTPTARSGR